MTLSGTLMRHRLSPGRGCSPGWPAVSPRSGPERRTRPAWCRSARASRAGTAMPGRRARVDPVTLPANGVAFGASDRRRGAHESLGLSRGCGEGASRLAAPRPESLRGDQERPSAYRPRQLAGGMTSLVSPHRQPVRATLGRCGRWRSPAGLRWRPRADAVLRSHAQRSRAADASRRGH